MLQAPHMLKASLDSAENQLKSLLQLRVKVAQTMIENLPDTKISAKKRSFLQHLADTESQYNISAVSCRSRQGIPDLRQHLFQK